jgi:hypothetical protein
MTEKRVLTRRRSRDSRQEVWHVFYDDVHVGSIGERAGVPLHSDPWGWSCGFYPGVEPRNYQRGTARTFELARAAFEAVWLGLEPKLTEDDFETYRRSRAFRAWAQAMWDAGCRLPTQEANGRSRCFCGAAIDNQTMSQHVYSAQWTCDEVVSARGASPGDVSVDARELKKAPRYFLCARTWHSF